MDTLSAGHAAAPVANTIPERPARPSVVRNSAANLFAFVLNAGLNLLTLILLARGLSMEEYGQYSLLYALMFVAQLATEAGFPTVLACRLAADSSQCRTLVAEATGLLGVVILVSTVGILGVGLAWTQFHGPGCSLDVFVLIAVGCAAMQVTRFCASVFQGFDSFHNDNIGKTLQAFALVISVVLLFYSGRLSLFAAVLLLVLSHLLTAGYMVVSYWRTYHLVSCQLGLGALRKWVMAAGWLGIGDILRRFTWNLDMLLLGLLQPAAAAGIYSVAYRPLATLIWVPIGVGVGLRPKLAEKVQPVAQFLAAFPANLLFPVVVYLIVRFSLDPKIWLSPLMILGTQWYILFNVIAGASAFPNDFREAATCFRIKGWRWWREVILPGIFPYYVTGAITASGGAWNASIVAEAVSWGPTRLDGSGLGAYIARMTAAGDYPRIALGVAVMSVMVVGMNRALWRPLYALAERRTRLA